MNKFSNKLDKIVEAILESLQEDVAQQQQMQQAQQTQVAPQQVDVQQQSMAAQPVAQVQEPIEQAQTDQQAPVDDQSGEQAVDGVDMSEIQELSGQLAQMIRDLKSTNPEQSVEASKFAAGMVVAAAIDGLDYKDRKDIIKKLKAGTSEASQDETTEEVTGAEQEQLSEDGQQEQYQINDPNINNGEDVGALADTFNNGDSEISVEKSDNTITGTTVLASKDAAMQYIDNHPGSTLLNPDNTVQDERIAESVTFTKAQMERIRMNEIMSKSIVFTKKELDEIFRI